MDHFYVCNLRTLDSVGKASQPDLFRLLCGLYWRGINVNIYVLLLRIITRRNSLNGTRTFVESDNTGAFAQLFTFLPLA